ncbi:hypothetical protein J7E97_26615 [Streptomyces sp. ISL-66]|uniref:hypothetical protein n=1 Tax=Streptomyces sp. ISL-66 TaxID=2819186 RepID=UPI001BE70DC2|nr:hypothetical protein [Streptomyces sp. ISL-66]MBT2471338.1 hypothetical protein [Streptomyces sp. ISL-66]
MSGSRRASAAAPAAASASAGAPARGPARAGARGGFGLVGPRRERHAVAAAGYEEALRRFLTPLM